jgi:hypothetical protein
LELKQPGKVSQDVQAAGFEKKQTPLFLLDWEDTMAAIITIYGKAG